MIYFQPEEFKCSCCGEMGMDTEFETKIDALRGVCGFPFIITSGYRCPSHPIEAKKPIPGRHSQRIAADIKITNAHDRYLIVKKAIELGFRGVGVASDFVHVDLRESTPVIWTY